MIKYYLLLVIRKIFKLFYILKVNNRKIMFYSYSGENYSCNPKYLSEYLIKNYPDKYEIVWAFKHPRQYKHLSRNYKIIKYGSLKAIIEQVTSFCIVTNTGTFKPIPSRKNQLVINTWHGGGAYKKTGVDNEYKNKYQKLYAEKLGQADVNLFLSSSKAFTECCIKGAFGYKGKILECGMPRNDILLSYDTEKLKKSILKKYGLDEKKKILLFAPTWRNYDFYKYEELDTARLPETLKARFSGEWLIILKQHHYTNNISQNISDLVYANNDMDMQELLLISDILISDYSSCIWDFSLMYKPCFLFVPDIEKYLSVFGLYTEIEKWGFEVCKTNEELFYKIKHYDMDKSIKKIKDNHKLFELCETGNACKIVSDTIASH